MLSVEGLFGTTSYLDEKRFKHERLLGAYDIRILTIESGSQSSSVYCRFSHCSLDDWPEFQAVSYTWGTPEMTKRIYLVEGGYIPATANCLDMIVHLRKAGIRRVWIDAVCIDQENPEERSQQVSTIGHIFQHATYTIVYLGPDDEHSRALAESPSDKQFDDLTDKFSRALRIGTHLTGGRTLSEEDRILRRMLRSGSHPEISYHIAGHARQYHAHVDAVLRRAWFSRTWILQEVLL